MESRHPKSQGFCVFHDGNWKVIHMTEKIWNVEITGVSFCNALFRMPVIAVIRIPLCFLPMYVKQHLPTYGETMHYLASQSDGFSSTVLKWLPLNFEVSGRLTYTFAVCQQAFTAKAPWTFATIWRISPTDAGVNRNPGLHTAVFAHCPYRRGGEPCPQKDRPPGRILASPA